MLTVCVVAVIFVELLPPQLLIVMEALSFIVKTADVVPCPETITAPGKLLHVYPPGGTTPGTDAVMVPPLQMLVEVTEIAGGAGNFVTTRVVILLHPLTSCVACNVHGPAPLNTTDAREPFGP